MEVKFDHDFDEYAKPAASSGKYGRKRLYL